MATIGTRTIKRRSLDATKKGFVVFTERISASGVPVRQFAAQVGTRKEAMRLVRVFAIANPNEQYTFKPAKEARLLSIKR
jgi:hypothetical protein